MKKKSMISALVLSVAMFGISTSGAFAIEYTFDGVENYNASANGAGYEYDNNLYQVRYTDADATYDQEHEEYVPGVVYGQTWGADDTINVTGGTLDITGYDGNATINGILNATGGTVNLNGGTLTVGENSTIGGDATFTSVANSILSILEGGDVTIGGGNDNVLGRIVAEGGSLTIAGANANETNITIGANSSIAGDVNLTVSQGATLGINGGTINIDDEDLVNGQIHMTGDNSIININEDGDDALSQGGVRIIADGGELAFNDDATLDTRFVIGNGSSANITVDNGVALGITNNVSTSGTFTNNGTTQIGTVVDPQVQESANITSHVHVGSMVQDNEDAVITITNGSLTVDNTAGIEEGTMNIGSLGTFNGGAGGFTLDYLNTAGTINAIDGGYEDYVISGGNEPGMVIGSGEDTQADFQIDILGRNNGVNNNGISADGHTPRRNSDQFIADQIVSDNGEGATINISNWSLNGDLYGWDAPMVRHVYLNDVFQGEFDPDEIQFTADNAINDNGGVFTPIGWYKLNANPNRPGSYTLDLAKFNPWVFRGQVTKIAQYQNQLAIDDMLFTHSMVLPSFKENDHGANASILANRYAASGSPLYAPYDYSRKDGGVWCKMYGNFEHLNMNRGLNVENNSFGALIGADLGLKELRGGWTFMPTAYIGYNGAHQNYAHNGAWQNGGQAGFLGTWYKDNFMIGALVYGGVYNNEMDTPRGNDDSFNYFAGGSIKTAYNWRFHRDWVLQPNFLVAYNYFGKENWHSDFGQMGMMSGQLHGVNVAPGLNLIWEKDTFSAYATLQYMYNVNQAVGGSAGYVGLPHIHMDRGYIQYGLGFNKRFGDRFSGYLQAVFRNVGRTGVGFQGGFNFALGKKPSNYNAELKGSTPVMQKAKMKMSSSHS